MKMSEFAYDVQQYAEQINSTYPTLSEWWQGQDRRFMLNALLTAVASFSASASTDLSLEQEYALSIMLHTARTAADQIFATNLNRKIWGAYYSNPDLFDVLNLLDQHDMLRRDCFEALMDSVHSLDKAYFCVLLKAANYPVDTALLRADIVLPYSRNDLIVVLKDLVTEGMLTPFVMPYLTDLALDRELFNAAVKLNDIDRFNERSLRMLVQVDDPTLAVEVIIDDLKSNILKDKLLLEDPRYMQPRYLRTLQLLRKHFPAPLDEKFLEIAQHLHGKRVARLLEKLSNAQDKDGFSLLTEENYKLALSHDSQIGFEIDRLVKDNLRASAAALKTVGLHAVPAAASPAVAPAAAAAAKPAEEEKPVEKRPRRAAAKR